MEGFKKYLFHYKKGDIIYSKDDKQPDFFIINKGRVLLKIEHNEFILIGLGKGDFFGEESLNNDQQATYTVEVIEDADIIKIPAPSLQDMMKMNTEISFKILRKLAEKNIKVVDNILKSTKQFESAKIGVKETDEELPSEKINAGIKAYLIIQRSNRIVQLTKTKTYLGRRDYTTGFIPDIDLTKEDEEKYISRKHAQISFVDSKFYISEEAGAINGTFLNGKRLSTGVKYEIQNEDEITLCHLNMIFKF